MAGRTSIREQARHSALPVRVAAAVVRIIHYLLQTTVSTCGCCWSLTTWWDSPHLRGSCGCFSGLSWSFAVLDIPRNKVAGGQVLKWVGYVLPFERCFCGDHSSQSGTAEGPDEEVGCRQGSAGRGLLRGARTSRLPVPRRTIRTRFDPCHSTCLSHFQHLADTCAAKHAPESAAWPVDAQASDGSVGGLWPVEASGEIQQWLSPWFHVKLTSEGAGQSYRMIGALKRWQRSSHW